MFSVGRSAKKELDSSKIVKNAGHLHDVMKTDASTERPFQKQSFHFESQKYHEVSYYFVFSKYDKTPG